MPELDFAIADVKIAPRAVAPTLIFALTLANRTPEVPIENVLLRAQIRIEPARRKYDSGEHDALSELFGEKERWNQTLKGFPWTEITTTVGAFAEKATAEIPVACACDLETAADKFFHGLEGGEAPLSFLFSGSVFYRDAQGRLQIAPIGWNKDARYRLPAALWRQLTSLYRGDAVPLRLTRGSFDRLYRFRRERGLKDWDAAIDALIAEAAREPAS